ncbi:MAG: GNAT family N-acetyltransferase [Blautia sp.]|nr:GNAT family N-acetyltransferase [Blautia sp.]
MEYRIATEDDIEVLTASRMTVLKAANQLDDAADMTHVEAASREYYQKALAEDTHLAILVMDRGKLIGTGGVSFFQVMPTYHNPSGKKAYIMNMYTDPAYRRQGIALKTLDMLVKAAKERGITQITLEATDMGRPLYEKYGFVQMKSEMELQKPD